MSAIRDSDYDFNKFTTEQAVETWEISEKLKPLLKAIIDDLKTVREKVESLGEDRFVDEMIKQGFDRDLCLKVVSILKCDLD